MFLRSMTEKKLPPPPPLNTHTYLNDDTFGYFNIVETHFNGNCFYDALSKSPNIPFSNETEVRKFIFSHALQHLDRFIEVYRISKGCNADADVVTAFIQDRGRNKRWANIDCIFFASVALETDIISLSQMPDGGNVGHHSYNHPLLYLADRGFTFEPKKESLYTM